MAIELRNLDPLVIVIVPACEAIVRSVDVCTQARGGSKPFRGGQHVVNYL